MLYAIIFVLIVISQVIFLLLKKKPQEITDPPDSVEQTRNTIFLYNRNESIVNNICYIILGAILVFIAAFRDRIGFDWYSYMFYHSLITTNDLGMIDLVRHTNMEPGFILLNMITPFALFVFAIAVISVTTKLWSINKYSEAKYISLLMYFSGIFFFFDMSGIRQGLAISVLLISLKFVLDKKLIYFLICVAVASSFHLSAVFFIPLYFLNAREVSRKVMYIVTAGAFVFSFINLIPIAEFFTEFIPIWSFRHRIGYYLQSQEQVSYTLSLIKRIAFLVIFVEFFRIKNVKDRLALICLNGYWLSIVILGAFSSIPTIASRGVAVLYILQIFVFAILFRRSEKLVFKFAIFAIVVALSINTMYGIFTHDMVWFIPYNSIFGFSW